MERFSDISTNFLSWLDLPKGNTIASVSHWNLTNKRKLNSYHRDKDWTLSIYLATLFSNATYLLFQSIKNNLQTTVIYSVGPADFIASHSMFSKPMSSTKKHYYLPKMINIPHFLLLYRKGIHILCWDSKYTKAFPQDLTFPFCILIRWWAFSPISLLQQLFKRQGSNFLCI